tara:strand:- start:423 stop:824 length:402 start_codon:yes stop_codon:yes gene_type:complete
MPFSHEDFKVVANVDRLRVIIMHEMEYYPLKTFKQLSNREQKRFNTLLNSYIEKLPDEKADWDLVLQTDFNEVCVNEIFTQDFDPSKILASSYAYPELSKKIDEEEEAAKAKKVEEVADSDDETEPLINGVIA